MQFFVKLPIGHTRGVSLMEKDLGESIYKVLPASLAKNASSPRVFFYRAFASHETLVRHI